MPFVRLTKYLLAGCSVLAFASVPASAQDGAGGATADAVTDDQILVTARRREESLQDAPVTVSAFTEQDIERQGISRIADYADLVPNVFLVETQNSTFSFPNIRGISQSRNIDQSVAVVIDGVLSTSPIALSQELFDIQQIEVYKGPQGALYGRNAIGGAINIQTKKPSNEFEGLLRGEFGNGDFGKAQAVVSGPLIEDELYGRAAVSYTNFEGVRENTFLGLPADANRNFSARTRFLWEPTDNFSADLRGSVSDDDGTAIGFIDIAPNFVQAFPGSDLSFGANGPFGAPGGPFGPATPNGNAGPTFPNPDVEFTNALDFLAPGLTPGPNASIGGVPGVLIGDPNNIDDFSVQTNLLGIDQRRIYNVSLKLDYDTDWFTVTTVSSFDQAENFTRGEQPPRTSANTQVNSQFRTSESFSQELRFTSPDDQRLRWIAGGYLALTDQFLSTTVQRDFDGTDTLNDAVFDDPFVAPICDPLPFPTADNGGLFDNQGNCVSFFQADEQDQTAYAFFGQLNFDLTDTLELSFSARYDVDERTNTLTVPQSLISPVVLALPDLPAGFGEGFELEEEFSSFQPLATIRWTPSSNFTAYATYSEGFRSGGFNPGGFSDLVASLNAGGAGFVEGIEDIFPQQDTRGGEVGFKTSFFEKRVQANVAAFFTDIDNYQTFTFVLTPQLGQQVVIPIDEVEIYGIEFDGAFNATDWLKFTAAFAYNSSEIIAHSNRGEFIIGNEAPLTPDTTLNLGIELNKTYDIRGAEVDAFFRADYQRIGTLFFLTENFAERDPLSRVGLVAGADINQDLSITGRVSNLTNENFCGEVFQPGGFCFPGQLRKWSIEVTKRF